MSRSQIMQFLLYAGDALLPLVADSHFGGKTLQAGESLLLLDNEPALIHLRGLAGEMAHLAKRLPLKHENLNLDA